MPKDRKGREFKSERWELAKKKENSLWRLWQKTGDRKIYKELIKAKKESDEAAPRLRERKSNY